MLCAEIFKMILFGSKLYFSQLSQKLSIERISDNIGGEGLLVCREGIVHGRRKSRIRLTHLKDWGKIGLQRTWSNE